MPIQRCEKDGKPGYQFGDNGFCYTFDPKDDAARAKALADAARQGQAIASSSIKSRGRI